MINLKKSLCIIFCFNLFAYKTFANDHCPFLTKDIIIKQIESKSIEMYKDSYDYLINISLISLSKEKLEELKQSYDKIKLEIEKVMEKSETEMWLMELEDLKKKLKTT